MTEAERLDKARSNEAVANLLAESEHWDWVVTAAFYSAVHLVEAEIFPLQREFGGRELSYQTLDEFAFRFVGVRRVDHTARKRAVAIGLSAARADYDKLIDLSQNARYDDYRTTKAEADEALRLLREIKAV